jgi:Bacterial dnaA protein helix-turn-helix
MLSLLQAKLRQDRIERMKRWHIAALENIERCELPKVKAKAVVIPEPPEPPPSDPAPMQMPIIRRYRVPTIIPLVPQPHWFYRRPSDNRLYPHLEAIQIAVAYYYNVTLVDMNSERRQQAIVLPRQIAYYLARHLTYKSLPEIGRRMGDRDHSTILHGCRKVEQLMRIDPDLTDFVEGLEALLTPIEPEALAIESSSKGEHVNGAQQ